MKNKQKIKEIEKKQYKSKLGQQTKRRRIKRNKSGNKGRAGTKEMQGRQENEYPSSNQDKVRTKQSSSREGNRRWKEMKRNWRDKEMNAGMKEGKVPDVCSVRRREPDSKWSIWRYYRTQNNKYLIVSDKWFSEWWWWSWCLWCCGGKNEWLQRRKDNIMQW